MASLNKVELIGNLGRDPETRSTQDGRKIVNLRIATSETWTDQRSGEKREKTEWHQVVIFNESLGTVAEKYARKGSRLYVAGKLQTRKWTDQQGVERYSTEIVLGPFDAKLLLLDRREGGGGGGGRDHDDGPPQQSGARAPAGRGDLDDEIPF